MSKSKCDADDGLNTKPDYGYLFSFFTGDESKPTDEQVYFAFSKNGRKWHDLCREGKPLLTSPYGEKGVRDPFVIRAGKDDYYILATDLHKAMHHDTWDDATMHGSKNIIVWHSKDLIHWEKPWSVDLGSMIENAGAHGYQTGCVWAPEAIKDGDEYFVFWSSYLNSENPERDHLRIYGSRTADFRTFSRPVLWLDANEIVLDATALKTKDPKTGKTVWYRASRIDHSIRLEKSRTENLEGEWDIIFNLEKLFQNTGFDGDHLEGPELFIFNPEDCPDPNTPLYGLMCDQFASNQGYIIFQTTDLSSSDIKDWAICTDADLGLLKKRHGSILNLTKQEYERLRSEFLNF